MNSARLWTLGSIVLIIALVAGTWFVGISPRLAEAAKANTERAGVEMLNAKHTATLAALKDQFEDLSESKAELEELRLAVPASDDSAALLRQLHSLARSAGVTVIEVTLSSPERFAAPAEPPAEPELAAALGSVNPENFLVIPLEQTVVGEQAAVMNYIAALQAGQRSFLIHDLSMEAGLPAGDTQVEVSFTGQIFVLLEGVAAAPADDVAPPTNEAQVPQ